MRIANALSPQHRFVLRSYTRLLVHCGDAGSAHRHLKQIDERDPWLLAARLSAGQLAGKRITSVRRELEALDSDLPMHQLAELAAAMATLEIDGGNLKRAKRYVKLAQILPNDNTVAQLRWISRECSWTFDPRLLETPLSFEAQTKHFMLGEKMCAAVLSCQQWLDDEPFSANPASLGCFIATEHLQDFALGKEFAVSGVRANPTNAGLRNNLAFAEAMTGELISARRNLELGRALATSNTDNVILSATEGCILFKEGKPVEGRQKYLAAVRLASDARNLDLALRAIVHAVHEQMTTAPGEAVVVLAKTCEILLRTKGLSTDLKSIIQRWTKPTPLVGRIVAPENIESIKPWVDELFAPLAKFSLFR